MIAILTSGTTKHGPETLLDVEATAKAAAAAADEMISARGLLAAGKSLSRLFACDVYCSSNFLFHYVDINPYISRIYPYIL